MNAPAIAGYGAKAEFFKAFDDADNAMVADGHAKVEAAPEPIREGDSG
jgi:hypothetical protein